MSRKESELLDDGSNLSNLLHNLLLKKGKIPERIHNLIMRIFPRTETRLEMTADGRIFTKILENGKELYPPSIADGFYKMLLVITALELNPTIFLIDEIENSLHPEALELTIAELKNSNIQVILTTHSPAVVDIVQPEDLILVEKGIEGSIFRRVEDPERIREKLKEMGITLSEKWLYGKL